MLKRRMRDIFTQILTLFNLDPRKLSLESASVVWNEWMGNMLLQQNYKDPSSFVF